MAAPASFRPGRGLATALTLTLGLACLANLFFAFVVGWTLYAMSATTPLEDLPFRFVGLLLELHLGAPFHLMEFWPLRILFIVTNNILFMIWLYRAHKNLAALGVENRRYKSHWAITGYFVPFLNLFRPFQIAREVWKGSRGETMGERTSALVRVWWELYLFSAILGEFATYAERNNALDDSGLVLAAYLLAATFVLVQLVLVRKIYRWQSERAGQVAGVPSPAAAPMPASPLVDVAVVGVVLLASGLLAWHGSRVVEGAFARWAEREEAAREAPPPPEPDTGGNAEGAQPIAPKEIEGIEGGVPGGVEGGVVGGVIGGVPGGVPSSGPAKPESAPQRIRVSQSHLKRVAGRDPTYPELAKRARIEGMVVMDVIIDLEGRVSNVRVVSGHPILVQAAVDAVKGWKYEPMMLNGKAVEVNTTVSVIFRLD